MEYRGEHVFRHTFATNCYYRGIDVKILSNLLGHADVNITYNIYVHLYGDGFEAMYDTLVRNAQKEKQFFVRTASLALAGAEGLEPSTKVLETHDRC